MNLAERVKQAKTKVQGNYDKSLAESVAHVPTGNFIYCGWSDAKTKKLQMETDKALRQHVAKFRFMPHVVVEPFDVVQM